MLSRVRPGAIAKAYCTECFLPHQVGGRRYDPILLLVITEYCMPMVVAIRRNARWLLRLTALYKRPLCRGV